MSSSKGSQILKTVDNSMQKHGKIDVALKKHAKTAQKRTKKWKTCKKHVQNTHKHSKTHAKTRAKTQNKAQKIFLTHVDFGPFFGRPGFPQKLALLLQPLPGMTGAAEKKKI